jgi:hypothetical protein
VALAAGLEATATTQRLMAGLVVRAGKAAVAVAVAG